MLDLARRNLHIFPPAHQPTTRPLRPTAALLFRATRPMFLPATAVPVAVGTAWGASAAAGLDAPSLLLALLGMALLHSAANVLNDVADDANGCDRGNEDRISPFTGGSRMIQDGLLSPRAMALWGVALLAAASLVGVALILAQGWTVLAFGLAGLALAAGYSLPPLLLANRGLGELAVAVAFGLPVAACAWLQRGAFDAGALIAAVAVGCWTAAILVANEVPDIRADAAAGKRTLVVRWGVGGARRLLVGLNALAFACQAALVARYGLAPWLALPGVLLFALAAWAAARLDGSRARSLPAIRVALAVHLLGGIALVAMTLAA